MPRDNSYFHTRLTASQRRDVTRRGKLVADGRWLYSEALNDLMRVDLRHGGEADFDTEERLALALSDATAGRQEGQRSWQERVAQSRRTCVVRGRG